MNALPASSSPKFISPLASKLVQFLAQKHAMGYRYREEGRALPELDRFLSTRLSPEDPVITLAIVQDYVARRGTESETTRASFDAHAGSLSLPASGRRPDGRAGSPLPADCTPEIRAASAQPRRG